MYHIEIFLYHLCVTKKILGITPKLWYTFSECRVRPPPARRPAGRPEGAAVADGTTGRRLCPDRRLRPSTGLPRQGPDALARGRGNWAAFHVLHCVPGGSHKKKCRGECSGGPPPTIKVQNSIHSKSFGFHCSKYIRTSYLKTVSL